MPRRQSLNVHALSSTFGGLMLALCVLALALFVASTPAKADERCECPQPGTHPGDAPILEIGSVTVYPGTPDFAVPIYLTSSEDVTSWQMGLDYGDLLLSVDDVEIDDTPSEDSSGSITVTFPDSEDDTFLYISVEYGTGPSEDGPLPAGERILVARIQFTADPGPATTVVNLRITGDDDNPVAVNETTIPATIDGSVTLLAGAVLVIGDDSGTVYDVFRVPVTLWSDSEATELYMGLDYADLLLSQIDLGGGPMEDMDSDDYSIDTSEVEGGCTLSIELLNGTSIEAGNELFLFTLEFELARPRHGELPVELASANLNGGDVAIPNLLDGSLQVLDHFIRGDINLDARHRIDDATRLLRWLFVEGAEPPCLDAADVNANGEHELADVFYLFSYIFKTDSPPPPAPFPDPGPAADDTALSCFPEE